MTCFAHEKNGEKIEKTLQEMKQKNIKLDEGLLID